MDSTTDLKVIAFGRGGNFTWGEAVEKHEIGEYTIIEYHPHEYVNCCSTGKVDYSKTEYSCYINHNPISRSTESLDAALACCIAYKLDGANTRADRYFMKSIKPI